MTEYSSEWVLFQMLEFRVSASQQHLSAWQRLYSFSFCLCGNVLLYVVNNNASLNVFQLRPPTVIGQFHTLFFGSVRMFFLGVLGFAVYGNEALHFSCDPDRRELNLFCYNQFRPITPQVGLSCTISSHQRKLTASHYPSSLLSASQFLEKY